MAELEPGDIFAGHRIDGVAGRGGMGVVYRATQLDLDRPVALKLIAAQLAEDPGFRERFVRESRIAAAIDHPHVIPIYYAGEEQGTLYLAMRYVGGEDLRAVVRRSGLLDPHRCARIVAQLGGALDAAHARGLVHRDVKPANVLVGTEDHVYLTDFGLSKRLVDTSALSRSGQWVGTLGYVAPEQIRGLRVDARTDVFALGCVLFFALTGATPFQRESDEATLWAHLNDPPEPVDVLAPDAPAAFAGVIAKALAKDPDDRYQSAGDLGRAALAAAGDAVAGAPEGLVAVGAAAPADDETIVSGQPAATQVTELGAAATRRRDRRRWLVGAAAFLTGAAIVVAVLVLSGVTKRGTPTTTPRTTVASTATTTTPPTTTTTPALPSGTITSVLNTGLRVNTIALLGATVYASAHEAHKVVAIVQRSAAQAPSIPNHAGTEAIATGSGSLWVLNQRRQTLYRLRKGATKLQSATTGLSDFYPGGQPALLTTGADSVWVGIHTPGLDVPDVVQRIAPAHGHSPIIKSIPIPNGALDIAVGYGSLWVLNQRIKQLTRIRLKDGAAAGVLLSGSPQQITVGDGAVWMTDAATDTLVKFSPYTLRATTVGLTGRLPTAVAVHGHDVWVVAHSDGTVTHFDASTNAVGEPFRVCAEPFAVVADAGGAWIGCVDGNIVRVKG